MHQQQQQAPDGLSPRHSARVDAHVPHTPAAVSHACSKDQRLQERRPRGRCASDVEPLVDDAREPRRACELVHPLCLPPHVASDCLAEAITGKRDDRRRRAAKKRETDGARRVSRNQFPLLLLCVCSRGRAGAVDQGSRGKTEKQGTIFGKHAFLCLAHSCIMIDLVR